MARQALRILGRSVADLWDNLFALVVANLMWSLSLMPGLGVAIWVGGSLGLALGLLLLVLITAPATLALYVMTIEVIRLERVEFGEFWRGLREYYRRGWLVGFLNLIFVIIALFNLAFYSSPSVQSGPLALGIIIWGYVAFVWFTMQIYLWPLAVRMEKVRVGGLLRNAFLASFKYPGQTLVLGVVLAIIIAVSILLAFLPLIMFGMVYITIVSNKALTTVLRREQERATAKTEGGGNASPYQVDVPLLPEKDLEKEPSFSTRNAPPGIKKRGVNKAEE